MGFLALIGTFFKCVKEDSAGKPVYSSRGLPILTKPGKYILSLLIASFLSSIWLTRQASQETLELKGHVIALQDQLATIQRAEAEAQKDNVERLSSVATELQGTSDLLNHEVRDVTKVSSFQFVLFFDEMARPQRLPGGKWLSTDSRRERGLVPRDSPGVLRDMICGLRATLEIPISSSLVFTAICGGNYVLAELGIPDYADIPLQVDYEVWDTTAQGMFVVFSVDADDLRKLKVFPETTLNSFVPNNRTFATFHMNRSSDDENEFRRLEPHLPMRVGVAFAPNGGGIDPESTWLYGPREHVPYSNGDFIRFAFHNPVRGSGRPEWPISRGFSQVDTSGMHDSLKQQP